MKPTRLGACAAMASLLLVACGRSGPSPNGNAGQTVITFDNLAGDVDVAAQNYRATVTAPDMTLKDCATTYNAYDRKARPELARMVNISENLDQVMDMNGGERAADFLCLAGAMMDELNAYRDTACASSDLATIQAGAARHAEAMAEFANHAQSRCEEMTSGLNGGGWQWSAAMNGCPGGPLSQDTLAVGERVFDLGLGADGEAISYTGGMGPSMVGCASCHGATGHGLAMFTSPNITYANLTDPDGMIEPDGDREGMTYTAAEIRRAVVQGIDADGESLDRTMPRWRLTDQEWNGLLAYLKTLQ